MCTLPWDTFRDIQVQFATQTEALSRTQTENTNRLIEAMECTNPSRPNDDRMIDGEPFNWNTSGITTQGEDSFTPVPIGYATPLATT
ncbi:hypothetical protein Dimus_025122 [Dionaea muscipula]